MKTAYYEARGFTPYYFAHTIFNIVKRPMSFLRNLEDILGDMATSKWCDSFPRYSNLHRFIEYIADDLLFEPDDEAPGETWVFAFLKHYGITAPAVDADDDDAMSDLRLLPAFDDALLALIEEIFHILFHDVVFLRDFNGMVAGYIPPYGEYQNGTDGRFTSKGMLKRMPIPAWVKEAVYHRDKGECRTCKKRIDQKLHLSDKEQYDHMIPLAVGGANDITNLQLLCEGCNRTKAASSTEVSSFYIKAYRE